MRTKLYTLIHLLSQRVGCHGGWKYILMEMGRPKETILVCSWRCSRDLQNHKRRSMSTELRWLIIEIPGPRLSGSLLLISRLGSAGATIDFIELICSIERAISILMMTRFLSNSLSELHTIRSIVVTKRDTFPLFNKLLVTNPKKLKLSKWNF